MRVQAFGLVCLVFVICSCGEQKFKRSERFRKSPEPKQSMEALPEVIKGQWRIDVGANSQEGFALEESLVASGSHAISAIVAPKVTFTLSDDHFVSPVAENIASYGSLDITALRDNALRVCGATRTQKCITAGLRVYTSGAPSPGLWSSVEEYGAPILTGSNTVGLGIQGAASLASITIGTKSIVKLSDFTSASSFAVPLSVDFSNAPASSYSTTVVIEYFLQ